MVGRRRDDRSSSRDRYHGAGSSGSRRKSASAEPEPETTENGVHPLNGIQLTFVVTRDMVFYCFDVLTHHLKRKELPTSKLPNFTNDP